MKKKSPNKTYYIYGKHACLAAISNKSRIIHKIYITEENKNLISINNNSKLEVITSNSRDISCLLGKDVVHQGITALVSPLYNNNLESSKFRENSTLAILDQVTDPHNLGAIIRTAAAFSLSGVIIPSDNSPPENAIVAKTSSGALETIPIYRVTNISSSIAWLKKQDFWVIGLDNDSNTMIKQDIFKGKTCIVLGAEGKGIRKLTKENCDLMVKIPIDTKIESLNVSNAASIAFYEAYLAKLNN